MPDTLPQPETWSPRPLVDIGVNLTHRRLRDDLDAVLDRARRAGVARQMITGTSVPASEQAAALAAAHPGELYATAGVHPHEAKDVTADWRERLAALAEAPGVRALGEMGLDFHRDFSPRDVQQEVFAAQLELAATLQRPVFLHERDSGGRLFELLAEHRAALPGGVLHCFTGGAEALGRALELDLHLGVTGWICDERRGGELQRLVREIPAERLLIETDAPFLTPRTIRPRPRSNRNEPGYLPWVLVQVAACRHADPTELAAVTTANACRLFGLPAPDAPGR